MANETSCHNLWLRMIAKYAPEGGRSEMSETRKWTPGPWKFARLAGSEELYKLQKRDMPEHEGYFRENDGSWVVGFENKHGQGRIAGVAFKGSAKRGQGWQAPDPEGMANARLIAAAPELYEALKALVDKNSGHNLVAAVAALAKAEGRGGEGDGRE